MIVKEDAGVNMAAIARWLRFLRQAKDVSMAELATAHGLRRSNLTTFINSGGKPGAVAKVKACRALVGLGVHADGTLCPGLHRWRVHDPDMTPALVSILDGNELAWGVVLVLRRQRGGGFLMLRYGCVVTVFVELSSAALDALSESPEAASFMRQLTRVALDQDATSMAQLLWVDSDESTVMEHLDALRRLYPGPHPAPELETLSSSRGGS